MTRENIEVIATYIAKTGSTVREAAKQFGISKSTIYKNITYDLKKIDLELYFEVKKVLEKNKAERHIRGGNSTREKYSKRK